MTYITKEIPYFLIQHGYHDQLVPVQQSINFAAAIEKIAGKGKVILEVFHDHVFHADPYFRSEKNIARVFDFIDHYLASSKK
jgi:alpha-beta hydrolase superfamily lysophospholipase